MPPYHSSVPHEGARTVGNVPLLPLRVTSKGTSARGPAPAPADPDAPDVVDEALDLFKANILFTTFEIRERSDLLLVYATLYVVLCLKRLARCASKERAAQEMFTQALERFALPGEADFPLNAFYEKPKSAAESDDLRKYLTQVGGRSPTNSLCINFHTEKNFSCRSAARRGTAWLSVCSTPR